MIVEEAGVEQWRCGDSAQTKRQDEGRHTPSCCLLLRGSTAPAHRGVTIVVEQTGGYNQPVRWPTTQATARLTLSMAGREVNHPALFLDRLAPSVEAEQNLRRCLCGMRSFRVPPDLDRAASTRLCSVKRHLPAGDVPRVAVERCA